MKFTKDDIKRLAAWLNRITADPEWALFERFIQEKADSLRESCMNDPEDNPFDRGRYNGMRFVMGRPKALIEQHIEPHADRDTETL